MTVYNITLYSRPSTIAAGRCVGATMAWTVEGGASRGARTPRAGAAAAGTARELSNESRDDPARRRASAATRASVPLCRACLLILAL